MVWVWPGTWDTCGKAKGRKSGLRHGLLAADLAQQTAFIVNIHTPTYNYCFQLYFQKCPFLEARVAPSTLNNVKMFSLPYLSLYIHNSLVTSTSVPYSEDPLVFILFEPDEVTIYSSFVVLLY